MTVMVREYIKKDLPTYDYDIGNLGLSVEFYIMVKNKDYDDSSIFSQMRGR